MRSDTKNYNKTQSADDRQICDLLAQVIERCLGEAENKVWHGHPVWFIDGNPVVGYSKLKDCIRLLFWSGQSFNTVGKIPGLEPEGKFKAAEVRYTAVNQVD